MMATPIKCGEYRFNLDHVTVVAKSETSVFVNFTGSHDSIYLTGEDAEAFLFIWDRMAVNALREYQKEQAS